jgi:diamine N-acetyltransferase
MTGLTGDEPITIVPINKRNWEEAANLQILPEQADFLTPNVFSIAESKFHPELNPCAIYAGQTMVGFVMYARDRDDDQYWIYRFMIDRRYQRKGFGRRAMLQLIELIRALPDAPEINIAYELGNTAAAGLYKSVGFIEGGIAPWGERTAKYTYPRAPDDENSP